MATENPLYPPPPYTVDNREQHQGYGFHPYYTQQPPYNQQHPANMHRYGQPTTVVEILVMPKDYFGLSIFTLLCCCLPVGVAALIFSYEVQSANAIGDVTRALKASNRAKVLNYVALGLGAFCWLLLSNR
ncbi:synapse differentiation-inducing gene protein 1-like [Branchiostoma floridae x Branchiostoma belcheri]